MRAGAARTRRHRLRQGGVKAELRTAAEILDDDVRSVICPDKVKTEAWLRIIGEAHEIGLYIR